MDAHTPHSEVPTWIPGLIVAFVVVALAYVFVYGGDPTTPALLVFGAIGIGLSSFALYLCYRFVVAVETIAAKH